MQQHGHTQISYDNTYMWNLKKKMLQINLFTKHKTDSQTENKLTIIKENSREGAGANQGEIN